MATLREASAMVALSSVHLKRWIEEHRDAFRPPVANKEVFPESEFIHQIIRGPNARNDFHIDPGDEIFYQLTGDITVICIDADGSRHEVPVREGEVMLCPAGTPHCPLDGPVRHIHCVGRRVHRRCPALLPWRETIWELSGIWSVTLTAP
jgi:3-hydroxyanthranilate 3,4-dioxygenase